jgi:hypothetical protein
MTMHWAGFGMELLEENWQRKEGRKEMLERREEMYTCFLLLLFALLVR